MSLFEAPIKGNCDSRLQEMQSQDVFGRYTIAGHRLNCKSAQGELKKRGMKMAVESIMQVLAQVPAPVVDNAASAPWITRETLAAVLVAVIGFATFFALMRISGRIAKDNTWSLADALSEEVEVGTDKKDSTGSPVKNNEGNIAKDFVMKASSSRLIALLGSIAIMMLYIGAGLSVLYGFVIKETVPAGTKDLTNFFVYGMVLFAPYVVNKFASIFGMK